MAIKVFSQDGERELVINGEMIDFQKLQEIFAQARTADPAKDIVILRDKSKTSIPNNKPITSIKFLSCNIKINDFNNNTQAIIAEIEGASNIVRLNFEGVSNLNIEMTMKIIKILFYVSRKVTANFEKLHINSGFEKKAIEIMSIYNTEWMKYFQQLWEIR